MFYLVGPSSAFATSPRLPPAELSVKEGKAPLKVKVTGPEMLLEKVRVCQQQFGGIGFSIDWGDGAVARAQKGKCGPELEHVYTVPGEYSVQVTVFHPGPTDAPEYDYTAHEEVKVTGVAGATASKLKILADRTNTGPIFYGTGVPPLDYFVETSKPIEVKAEILKQDGTVLASYSENVSSSGTRRIPWNNYGDGPKAEQYKDGELKARYRLTANGSDGKQLTMVETALFSIYAKANFRSFELSPSIGKAPLTVNISYTMPHAECFSYIVEWGDGSDDTKAEVMKGNGKGGCSMQTYRAELTHVYKKRGSYMLRWYDNTGNPFAPAAKGPGYMEKQVKVD